jgi:hypothetical protein
MHSSGRWWNGTGASRPRSDRPGGGGGSEPRGRARTELESAVAALVERDKAVGALALVLVGLTDVS